MVNDEYRDSAKHEGIASDHEFDSLAEKLRKIPRLRDHLRYLTATDNKWEQFKAASRSVGLIVTAATLTGISITLLSLLLPDNSIRQMVVKDIGLGLIVSGISVFGFEWFSHLNKALKKIDALNAAILETLGIVYHIESLSEVNQSLGKIRDQSGTMFRSIYAESKKSLPVCLSGLFSETESEKKFSAAIQSIVASAIKLKESKSLTGQEYLQFIVWFLDRIASYTKALAAVDGKETDPRWYYTPPKSIEVTSEILAHQIRSMAPGDEYKSVSNVLFWVDRGMKSFLDESHKAIDRGVKIRRVFNLGELSSNSASDAVRNSKARHALSEHIKVARESENYEIKFLTKEVSDSVYEEVRHLLEDRENLYKYTFGLFQRNCKLADGGERHEITRFRAVGPDISELRLKYSGSEDTDLDVFDAIWDKCPSNMEEFALHLESTMKDAGQETVG